MMQFDRLKIPWFCHFLSTWTTVFAPKKKLSILLSRKFMVPKKLPCQQVNCSLSILRMFLIPSGNCSQKKCAILPDMWQKAQPVDGRTNWMEGNTVVTAMEYLPYQLIQDFVTNGVHILSQISSSPTVLIGEKISTFGGIPPAQPNSNPEGTTFQTRKGINPQYICEFEKKMYPPNQTSKENYLMKNIHQKLSSENNKKRVSSCVQLFSTAPANPNEGMATLVNTCDWANKEWIWTVKRKETTRLKDFENMYTSHKILKCPWRMVVVYIWRYQASWLTQFA